MLCLFVGCFTIKKERFTPLLVRDLAQGIEQNRPICRSLPLISKGL